MNNTLIDNTVHLKLVDMLKAIISNPKYNHLQIATGYWDLPGMALLVTEFRTFFERGGRLELLIGKEPLLRSYQLRNDLPKEEKFPDFYIKRDVDKLNEIFKPIVELILNYVDVDIEGDSQIKIHVYGQQGTTEQFLHAKCYIAYNEDAGGNANEAIGIIGSSNFTKNGLQDNAELNYLETNVRNVTGPALGDVKSHESWFKEKWNQSEPWTGQFINEILLKSPIGRKVKLDNETVKLNVIKAQTTAEAIKQDPVVEHNKNNNKCTRKVTNHDTRLRITMPNGLVIEEQDAAESMRKFVLMVGVDTVRKICLTIGLKVDKNPLVTNTVDKNYQGRQKPLGNGWLLNTHSKTISKRSQILRIAKAIGLSIIVEIIPK